MTRAQFNKTLANNYEKIAKKAQANLEKHIQEIGWENAAPQIMNTLIVANIEALVQSLIDVGLLSFDD